MTNRELSNTNNASSLLDLSDMPADQKAEFVTAIVERMNTAWGCELPDVVDENGDSVFNVSRKTYLSWMRESRARVPLREILMTSIKFNLSLDFLVFGKQRKSIQLPQTNIDLETYLFDTILKCEKLGLIEESYTKVIFNLFLMTLKEQKQAEFNDNAKSA